MPNNAVLRAAVFQIVVRVLGESHLVGFQQGGGGGFGDMFFFGHGGYFAPGFGRFVGSAGRVVRA